MHARIVTFRLDGPSHDEYHAQALAVAGAFNEWPGLRSKLWIGDREAGRYGGIYVFDSAADADTSRFSPEFTALEQGPFTDLSIEELHILDGPTAITGGALVARSDAA